MSLLILAAAFAMVSADAPQPTAARASDVDIRRALLQEFRSNPERKVCVQRIYTGSRQPRAVCGTLREFFEQRKPEEIAAGDPPYELLEQIKENRRKAQAKARTRG